MTLNADHVAQFQQQGLTVVHHFFDRKEVIMLQTDLDRLVREGKLRNVATEGDGQTHSNNSFNLQVCPVGPHSDVIRALPFSQKVRSAVEKLIGEDFILQLDQIFLKPAQHGAGTNWHQDNAYFGIPDPRQGTGMWIALHDATIENGTMHVVPGSCNRSYEHARDPGSDHHITCVIDEDSEVVMPVEMEAGGVLFFNYGTAHCTKGNHSNSDRAGLALHFLKSEHKARTEGRGGAHPYLSGPHYSRGEEEFGVDMERQWDALLADVDA